MKIGDKLENLKMESHTGAFIHSLSLIGESKLLFVNMSFCTLAEIQNLAAHYNVLYNNKIEVYLFNNQPLEINAQMQREHAIPFTIISDKSNALSKSLKSTKNIINRNPFTCFLFDFDGRLIKKWQISEIAIDMLLHL